jgi:transmembrane sensor
LQAVLDGGPAASAGVAAASPSLEPAASAAVAEPAAGGSVAPGRGAAAPNAWKGLAQQQKYREALASAEAEGFEETCRKASARDLVLLGNAARFAGSAARAEQAFKAVRSRFSGSAEASMAAFYLGRIAYDQRGDRRQAVEWFRSYLREAPGGAFAREAAGRLLEAERALGDRGGAQAAARSYLDKYPSGPHAGLAREMLGPWFGGTSMKPNGNTIICNWPGHGGVPPNQPQCFELTRDKHVVWELKNPELAKISNLELLDPDASINGVVLR